MRPIPVHVYKMDTTGSQTQAPVTTTKIILGLRKIVATHQALTYESASPYIAFLDALAAQNAKAIAKEQNGKPESSP